MQHTKKLKIREARSQIYSLSVSVKLWQCKVIKKCALINFIFLIKAKYMIHTLGVLMM